MSELTAEPHELSDEEITTLAGKVSIVLSASDQTVDLTNLTPEDFKALAAKAMERVDAGESGPEDASKKTPNKPCLTTTGPTLNHPAKCDSDVIIEQ